MSPEADKPVFPIRDMNNHPGPLGITLRDYIAIQAMVGLYSCPVQIFNGDGSPAPCPLLDTDIARMAYAQADAMLYERMK